MWLFTRYGFYSAASAQTPAGATDPSKIMIRARRRAHLENLKARFPQLESEPIVTLPHRDYRWRMIVSKERWVSMVTAMANEQEWSNFKHEAARYQSHARSDYIHALHAVWSVMNRLQQTEGPTPTE